MKVATLTRIASYTIAFAGVIHIYLAPQHFAHASAHGILFAVSGVAELVWAYLFLREPSERMYNLGIMLAGGLIILWAITRVLPAPFEHEVGVVDLGGILCKFSELAGLVALVSLASLGRIAGLAKRSFARLLSEALIISMFIGVGAYVAGHEFEPLMPFLEGQHEEQPQ
jgi:hypothetical protein